MLRHSSTHQGLAGSKQSAASERRGQMPRFPRHWRPRGRWLGRQEQQGPRVLRGDPLDTVPIVHVVVLETMTRPPLRKTCWGLEVMKRKGVKTVM